MFDRRHDSAVRQVQRRDPPVRGACSEGRAAEWSIRPRRGAEVVCFLLRTKEYRTRTALMTDFPSNAWSCNSAGGGFLYTPWCRKSHQPEPLIDLVRHQIRELTIAFTWHYSCSIGCVQKSGSELEIWRKS